MLRKSLIVAAGFLGLFLAGTALGSAPASAGYACGPWNKWCSAKFWAYPGYHHGWHGHKKWGKAHAYKHWNKGKHHSHKGKKWKKYH